VGHVARMGKKRNVYRLLVGRPRCRWVDIIRMDLGEVGWGALANWSLCPLETVALGTEH
jgi:hypothetical protein